MNLADMDKRKVLLAGAVAAVVLLAGMALAYRVLRDSDSDPDEAVDPGNPVEQTTTSDASSSSETTEGEAVPLADVSLTTTEIGTFNQPISIRPRVNDTALYVAEREGRVRRVVVAGEGRDRTYTPDDEPLIDISDVVTVEGERGLLDIAFSPSGNRLYLSYSQRSDGASKVVAFDYDGTTVDEGSRREIITIEDFASNHNGGDIQFGPDGFLYIAMGDGGGRGDPEKTAQDTERLLGKLLRIDPEGATGGEPYAIPPDNPFADGSGGRPEIWLYGVRNPWRFSFDSSTDDLWIGDVGQGSWEEIDYLPASAGMGRGANLGWSQMEGAHPFEGGSNPPDGVLPIFEYPTHESGCAVTGGFVYRGTANSDLEGAYVFGDFCKSRLRAIRQSGGSVVDERTFDAMVDSVASFGEDNTGELYAVSLEGPIFRLDP